MTILWVIGVVMACSSGSSVGDETCTGNGGVCDTSGKCSDQLPYQCSESGAVCCKVGSALVP